jgi:tetratricopeptide (TPR) repeat protein
LGDDLDPILLMALRKEPERRYSSVEQFAEDVQRYLDHRPILARPDTVTYRARKYFRRHWLVIAAASVALAGVLGGSAAALYQARVAQNRFNQVRKLANRFLFDFDKEIAPILGTVKAREMIVSTALEYLGSLEKDAAGDPQLQWELATAYAKVGDVQGSPFSPSLNHTKDAIVSTRKAISLAGALAARGLLSSEQRSEYVLMLRNLQVSLMATGDYQGAIQTGEEQVAQSAGLPLLVQDNSVAMLSIACMFKGDLIRSRDLAQQSLTISRQLVAADPTFRNRAHLASALRQLGQVDWNLARVEEARPLLDESVVLFRQCRKEQPRDIAIERGWAVALDVLAQVIGSTLYPSLERQAEADPYYEELLRYYEGRLSADPKDRSTQHDMGAVIERVGAHHFGRKLELAIAYTRRAVQLRDASDDNPADKAAPRARLAEALLAVKRDREAQTALEEALPLLGKDDMETQRDVALAWARLEAARGHLEKASDWTAKSIRAGQAKYDEQPLPTNAHGFAIVLDFASTLQPNQAPEYRRRVTALWRDQNRRFPGVPYLQKRLQQAENNESRR